MASLSTFTILVAGVIIGLLLGLTGGGGSILTVPLLVYVVGLDAKVAIATSLLVVGLASLAALLPHSRAGNVYWRTGIVFGAAGMVGAYSGGWIAQFIPDVALLLFFAGIMVASALAMLRRRPVVDAPPEADSVERSWMRIVGDGFVVGIVTGLVGAGGGFLVVPALALLGGLPIHAAIGTSLLVIAMKSFAGLAGYVSHVPIDVNSAAIVGAMAIAGTLFGSRLARALSGPQLRQGFGLFVLLVAAVLFVVEGSRVLTEMYELDRPLGGALIVCLECLAALAYYLRKGSDVSPAHPLP